MRVALVLVVMMAACTDEPADPSLAWAGLWSNGTQQTRIEACHDRAIEFLNPFGGDWKTGILAIGDPPYASIEGGGSMSLDGDVLHATVDGMAFEAMRIGPDNGDATRCPQLID